MPRKHILVSHDDLDGYGANVIFQIVAEQNGFEYEIYNVNYTNVNAVLGTIAHRNDIAKLMIVDISPRDSLVIQMLDDLANNIRENRFFTSVVLLDHHETSADRFRGIRWANFNFEKSGTLQFYEYMVNKYAVDSYETFARLVDDYDRWVHKYPESNRLNTLFQVLGPDDFVYRCLYSDGFREPHLLSEAENALVDNQLARADRYAEEKLAQIRTVNVYDASVGIIFCDQFQSHIGEAARQKDIHVDCLMMIDAGKGTVSLRRIKDGFHVGEFAQNFNGGGGNPAAAGFQLTECQKYEILTMILPIESHII